MYTIILLSILTIVGLLAGWLIDRYTYADGWSCASYFTGVISGLVLVGFLCALINIDRRIDATVYKYETIVQMVDSYDGQDYGNMGSLVESVVDMNETIAYHKANHDSTWMGLWYSERIANLEPIRFDRNRPALE